MIDFNKAGVTSDVRQRYLVAKYAADLRRMEPKNIGVILWVNGEVSARFLDREEATFVNDLKTYNRWIDHWTRQMDEDVIELPHHRSVPKDDPEYLDALARTQKGNYLLWDGGLVIDPVPGEEIEAATTFLFEQLVATDSKKARPDAHESSLKEMCRSVFEDANVWHRPGFHKSKYDVVCRVGDVWRQLTFSYGLGDSKPKAIFQRAAIAQDQSANSAAFLFDWVLRSKLVGRESCVAMVSVDENDADERTVENIEMLQQFCVVVNTNEHDRAVSNVANIVSLSP